MPQGALTQLQLADSDSASLSCKRMLQRQTADTDAHTYGSSQTRLMQR